MNRGHELVDVDGETILLEDPRLCFLLRAGDELRVGDLMVAVVDRAPNAPDDARRRWRVRTRPARQGAA